MARKPIGEIAMTPAERKARSRAVTREELEFQIGQARECIREVFVSVNLDVQDRAFLEAALDHLTLAAAAIPRS